MKQHYLVHSFQVQASKYQKFLGRLKKHLALAGPKDQQYRKRLNYLSRQVESLRLRLTALQPKLVGFALAAGLSLNLLGAPEVSAQDFVLSQARNPFGSVTTIQDNYDWTLTVVGDLDNDGDQDLILNQDGGDYYYYYRNDGSTSSPSFTLVTGSDSPVEGLSEFEEGYAQMALVDIDDDGDLDLIAAPGNPYYDYNILTYSTEYERIKFFKNTGTNTAPVFTDQTGTNNIFSSVPFVYDYLGFAMADIDNDGDQDYFLVNGSTGDGFFYYNLGTVSAPNFVLNTGLNPLPDFTPTEDYIFVRFVDIDNDGDQDFVAMFEYGEPLLIKNTGTVTLPLFSPQTGTNSPFVGEEWADLRWPSPDFADLNNDGLKDLVISVGEDDVTYLLYNSGTASAPRFATPISLNEEAGISFADFDGDGDMDMIAADNDNNEIQFFENTGTAAKASYELTSSCANPFNNIYQDWIVPASLDLDGDGDIDVVVGTNDDGLLYIENTGSETSPNFSLTSGSENDFASIGGYDLAPAFADLDNDADQDLVMGDKYGDLFYYINNGSASTPNFELQTASTPLDNISLDDYSDAKPAFADVDGDGDLDMLVGLNGIETVTYTDYYGNTYTNTYPGSGALRYFQNTGTPTAASFTEQTGTNNPFSEAFSEIAGTYFAPTFVDIDDDGDIDLFIADGSGQIFFVENKVNAPTSVVAPKNANFTAALDVYPNPAQQVVNFKMEDAIGAEMTISILNLSGVQVYSQKAVNNGFSIELAINNLDAGMYILQVQANGKTAQSRFVKQ
jgi:hypothetical protein